MEFSSGNSFGSDSRNMHELSIAMGIVEAATEEA
jgi:hypothetical protein